MEKLEWSALEYEEKERGSDWFWALGIIVVTSSIASIIFGNYFFAALLLISGTMLGFFAVKKPEIIHYELNSEGLKVRDRLYLYKNIKSFWIRGGVKPLLIVKSERVFMPIMGIQIEAENMDDIRSIMLGENIKEEEIKEHPSIRIMDSLGF